MINPTISTTSIDAKMAESVLHELGYMLQDLSLEYGDVVIPSGDITHQLYRSSIHSAYNLFGYVWCENGLYYISTDYYSSYRTPEEAAVMLIDKKVVAECVRYIQDRRDAAPDYD